MYQLNSSKSKMDAEIQMLKLQEEIDKLKKKHMVNVAKLKVENEEQRVKIIALEKRLYERKKPKIELSVSNPHLCVIQNINVHSYESLCV